MPHCCLFLYFIRKVFQDMIKANSAIINPAVLTELIPPIVAAAVRICGRESPAAIGFLTKGHPYYITMHMKKIILPATLTPPGLPVYIADFHNYLREMNHFVGYNIIESFIGHM